MAPGQYCNVLKGEISTDKTSCSSEVITVNADSTISLNVEAWDAMAIHQNAKLTTSIDEQSDWQRTVIFISAQTQTGQDLFIRGGIDHTYANAELGRNCQNTNFECAMPIRHNNLSNEPQLTGIK
eukprot:TRINITY_DN8233_c0_g1_i1.p1 TRINITY_DN8233_c0_g1~~TRINITY_DN8233_c0_g1_i1.p1  ORF type:complete len:125 (-),score=14.57 TRINITY_DN8233_c0_g1_i1:144-518(-)